MSTTPSPKTSRLPSASDLPASFVVFLIALPLSMGIAQASGVPLALGLITAVIGALVVGVLGGAHLQVAGPSAGLAALMFTMVSDHGLAAMGIAVMIAGVLQLAAGIFKIGRNFQAVAPSVVRGMLTGIGVLIIAGQFHVMIDDSIHATGLKNILAIPTGIWKAATDFSEAGHRAAALIGISTLVVTALWDRFKPAKLKVLPGPLLGAFVGAGLAKLMSLPINYVVVPNALGELLTLPTTESLGLLSGWQVWLDGGALAFVMSAETLLCATAVARMHDGPRTNYDRELAAQGFANVLCGAIGTIPVTGVISRSTANVNANAQSRYSVILHGIWIVAFVLMFPSLLELVPTSSLAAILIFVGVKLLNIKEIKKLASYGKPNMVIFICTVVGVVGIDLLKGIILGLVLSVGYFVYQMSHVHFELKTMGNRLELHMFGSATFMALPKLADALEAVPAGKELHIYFDELTYIDHACMDFITEFEQRYEKAGGELTVEWDSLMACYKHGERSSGERQQEWKSSTTPGGLSAEG